MEGVAVIDGKVVNDGEVTALAGSMSLKDGALLGISMGTSEAAGFCAPDGSITSGLNKLAFAPIDYRDDAPADEWSGDIGCGVQCFSQQGVARLATAAGFAFSDEFGGVACTHGAGSARTGLFAPYSDEGDVKHSMASVERRAGTGFRTTSDFDQGLSATIRFFSERGP